MASASPEDGFIYPDPSLLRLLPSQQFLPARATALAAPSTTVPAQGTAPATSSTPPAPPPGPFVGPIPVPRLSAAGLQRFPVLTRGLQAPIELTDGAQIAKWNHNISRVFDNTGVTRASLKSRKSKARRELKKLWEAAGGTPYIPRLSYKHA